MDPFRIYKTSKTLVPLVEKRHFGPTQKWGGVEKRHIIFGPNLRETQIDKSPRHGFPLPQYVHQHELPLWFVDQRRLSL